MRYHSLSTDTKEGKINNIEFIEPRTVLNKGYRKRYVLETSTLKVAVKECNTDICIYFFKSVILQFFVYLLLLDIALSFMG